METEKADEEKEREDRRGESFLRMIFENIDQYAFGIITQHGYQELENKVNEHALEIEKKFHKWFLRGLVAFSVMGLACSIALIGFGILLTKQNTFLDTIKETRRTFVYDSCTAQNKRHDDTVAKLIKLSKQAPPQPDQDERLKATIGLIDALAPKQACAKLAAVSVGEAEPPPPVKTTP